jgi:SAM-dependent methyltransferase
MSSGPDRYVLRGGQQGFNRLILLARARWPDTLSLLQRAGIGPGVRCVDIGCGGGEVTFELARLVGPTGHVTGIERDGVKVELARQAVSERKVPNVDLRQMDAVDWSDPGTHDLVYSRLLLRHLRAPVDLLRRMWAGVRPGGVIAVEDADHDGWCCDPPNAGFDFFVRTYREVLQHNGGDPTIGRKLHRYFSDAGIPSPQLHVAQPVLFDGEAKSLAWTTLEASTEAIAAAGLATRAEIAAQLASLAEFTQDPTTLISGPRFFQAWSRRPKGARQS